MCKRPTLVVRAAYAELSQGDEEAALPEDDATGPSARADADEPLLKLHEQPPTVLGVPVATGVHPGGSKDKAEASPSCCFCFDVHGLFGCLGYNGERPSASAWLKLAILIAVTLQNTAYTLLRRYSRGHLKESYSTSSALAVMELAKLALSSWQLLVSSEPSDVPAGSACSKYAHLLARSAKMVVPAVLYLAMNVLSFYAIGRIDASTFSIVAQLKILTTGLFAVAVLGRRLHCRKWRALFTLTCGVVLISEQTRPKGASASAGAPEVPLVEWLLGMGAVIVEVLMSGFASIYFEKVLKSADETYSVWDRNFQLAFWSLAIYLPMAIYDNPFDPFAGWSCIAAACAFLGALGGVLVALSIKHTDSVMKTIATTGSIVLTTMLNAGFLDGPFNSAIVIGTLVVITSVFNYSDNGGD